MAFPYSQSPPYDAPAPDLNPSGGSYYTPQDAPHGYGAQQPYGQPGQLEQYTSVHTTQHDLSPQAQHYQPPPPRDFLSPSDALGYQHAPRNYEARGRQGSNAEYYNQHTDEHRNISRSRRSRSRASSSAMKDRSGSRSRSRSGSSGQDRGLAGTLMGGASGWRNTRSMVRIITSAIAIAIVITTTTIIIIMIMGISINTTMTIGIIGAVRDIVDTVIILEVWDRCGMCSVWH
ncbi:hypothetical protein CNMCM8812_000793 [Aspergillus fumigatus]|nr:hypothetical protein CNMCM8714_003641 [Aspergillus fumigatus]KAF4264025.1 hypothetical protein CNMCM8057_000925 [Aspergillus fumigatus]KAF4271001.1 hypothetical protein CNMCM8812_000793 [Aspergillus fumigatus]KAF4280757.1 hypothetical protein CNMCM8689_001543 [Aspergillus fumigatus]KAF4290169.1 hypothetical protein CNMCM8686_001548 [Aspergillus fumigatus]